MAVKGKLNWAARLAAANVTTISSWHSPLVLALALWRSAVVSGVNSCKERRAFNVVSVPG